MTKTLAIATILAIVGFNAQIQVITRISSLKTKIPQKTRFKSRTMTKLTIKRRIKLRSRIPQKSRLKSRRKVKATMNSKIKLTNKIQLKTRLKIRMTTIPILKTNLTRNLTSKKLRINQKIRLTKMKI